MEVAASPRLADYLTLEIMVASISKVGKSRGRPKVGALPITMRLPPDLVAALDAWIEAQPVPRPQRTEAIRLALRDFLTERGVLAPGHEGEESE